MAADAISAFECPSSCSAVQPPTSICRRRSAAISSITLISQCSSLPRSTWWGCGVVSPHVFREQFVRVAAFLDDLAGGGRDLQTFDAIYEPLLAGQEALSANARVASCAADLCNHVV